MAEEIIAKCPSCRRPVNGPAPSCPHCHVSLRKLDLKFGVAPKHLGSITDHEQILTSAERRRLTTLLALFQRRFPQTTFEVVIAESPASVSIGEYTFWLANRMRFSAIEAKGERNFDLLLVVNTTGESGLSAGYGLENLIAEEDLHTVLEAGRPAFVGKRWAEGIERCVQSLLERLRDLCRKEK